MKKISDFIVKKKWIILITMLLLLIPSLIGYKLTKINYDILVYLPSDIETLKGEKILTDDFNMGAFSIVITDNMESKDIIKLEDEFRKIDTVTEVVSLNDVVGTRLPVSMLPSNITKRLAKDDSSLILVTFSGSTSDDDTLNAVSEMRKLVKDKALVGGMSAMVLDTKELFNSEMLLYVVIAVIFCIIVLELSLDSFLVPFLLMANIGVAILFNMGSNIFLGDISYITKAIAAVLQLGVTTDFSIFLYHKYEKEKEECSNKEEAMSKAIQETFTSVIGSSLTTIAGFLALCTMQLTLGVDIGIVMAKGVLIGVICVLTVFPALLLMFDKKIEERKHKELLPEFNKVKEFVLKHYLVIFIIFITLLVPAYLSQRKTEVYYKLDTSIPEDYDYSKASKILKEDYNMVSQEMVLIDKNTEDYTINEMVSEIKEIDGIDVVINPSSLTKYGIDSIIPENLKNMYQTDNYKMIIILSNYDIATDELNNQITQVNNIVRKYDSKAILAGEGPLMKDLVNTTDTDFKNVNYTSIGVIFILMMFVLKSISLPVLLVTAIEFAIFINMGVPYYTGTKIPFIASVVIGTIQLGATIDYAILMTTKYLEERSIGKDKKEAVRSAMDNSVRSIFVSAMCFFAATIGVGIVSKIDMIGCLCRLISRGAIVSMLVVICIVPSILLIFDKLIMKTTLKKGSNIMKKSIKKVLSLSLILVLLNPLSVFALTKEETVYSKLNSDGSVKSTVVNEHYINSSNDDTITDITDLTNLINTNSDSKFNIDNNKFSIESKGKDIYFQGSSSKELPLTTKVSYKLDGKDIKLKDLLGKNGKVEITIKYINNSKKYVTINGKNETLYTPFIVGTVANFDNINNSNILVNNGKVVDNGIGYAIIGLSTPGLYESLNLDSLKGLDEVVITLDTTKFSLPSIYSLYTSKVIDINDINIFKKLDNLNDSISLLSDSMNKIESGSKELKEGSSKLKNGLEQAINSLSSNNTTNALTTDQVNAIKNSTVAAVNSSFTNTKKAQIASTAWQQVSANLNPNDQGLKDAVSASIESSIVSYLTSTGLLNTYLDCVNNSNMTSCSTINNDTTYQLLLNVANQAANGASLYVAENVSKLVSVSTAVETAKETASSVSESLSNTLANSVKTTVLENVSSSLTTLYNGVDTLDKGISSLSDGISTFNEQGIKEIANLGSKVNTISSKLEKLEELGEEYNSYSNKGNNTKSSTKFISVIEGKEYKEKETKKETKTKKKSLWDKFIDLFK